MQLSFVECENALEIPFTEEEYSSWGHPGCFLELFGEILEGTIRQVMSNLCEVHCSDPNDFFCVFNLHLTEIFDRTAAFFLCGTVPARQNG